MSAVKRKIKLRKLKEYDTIWHPESTVVFKSKKERLVIGRYDGNSLLELDQQTLDLCSEWKFKVDESLLSSGHEEEEEEQSGEEPPQEQSGEEPPQEQSGEEPPQEQSGEEPPQEQSGEEPPQEQSGEEDISKSVLYKSVLDKLEEMVNANNSECNKLLKKIDLLESELVQEKEQRAKLEEKLNGIKNLFK